MAFNPDYLGGGFSATFSSLTVTGNFSFSSASVQSLFLGDNDSIKFGNTVGSPDFSLGVNSSDSDNLTLSRGGTLGTTNIFTVNKTTGAISLLGSLTLSDGQNLVFAGGNASGEGNIQFQATASNLYDTNLSHVSSNDMTMGMIASVTPTFAAANGPYIGLRGITYTAVAAQRGVVFVAAGNPGTPAANEGEIRFLTGADVQRMVIDKAGVVYIPSPSTNRFVVGGTAALAGQMATIIGNTGGVGVLALQNTTAANAGYAQLDLYNSSGTNVAGFGYGNTATVAATQDRTYFYTVAKAFHISTDSNTTRHFVVAATTGHITQLATLTGGQTGYTLTATGSGTVASVLSAAKFTLAAGYTGSGGSFGVYAQNASAGTATDEFSNVQAANYGEYIATTVGTVVGQAGYASGGDKSYGGFFRAIITKASSTNIGVGGFASNGANVEVGGFFGLMNSAPTYVSAALIADNGATTNPVFIARDNGTAVFTIADTGIFTFTMAAGTNFNITSLGTAGIKLNSGTNTDPYIHLAENTTARADIFYNTSTNTFTLRAIETASSLALATSNLTRATFDTSGNLTLTPGASTSGSPTLLTLTGPAHTGLTAAEAKDIYVNLNRTVTMVGTTGTITQQRAIHIEAPTYAFSTTTHTISSAVLVSLGGAPLAGTNATIQRSSALSITGTNHNSTVSGVGLQILANGKTGSANLTNLIDVNVSSGIGNTTLGSGGTIQSLYRQFMGTVTYDATAAVTVSNAPATLYIEGAPIASTNVTFTNPARAIIVGSGTSQFGGHIWSTQTSAPTSSLTSTTLNDGGGSGASITVTAGSTDSAGSFTVTAGNGTPGAGVAGQIVFNAAYSAAPKCVIVTSKDADGVNNQIYITNVTTSSFTINFNIALGTSEAVEFYYWVIG